MFVNILYLVSAVFFILALKGLSSAESSKNGNFCGIIGMLIACVAAYSNGNFSESYVTLFAVLIGGLIGAYIAYTVSMTSLPQMVAGFHTLVGLAAVLVACCAYCSPETFKILGNSGIYKASLIEMSLGAAIGAITFTGSLIAFLKLNGNYKGTNIPLEVNAFLFSGILCLIAYFVFNDSMSLMALIILLSFVFGATLIMPIGGADMPVIVSMLNSYSGWAASGIGFTLNNDLLIITGALVGASGAILSYIMCKGMNRSLLKVIFTPDAISMKTDAAEAKVAKKGAPEDAAFILKSAGSVIIVPGYGMATAQAQHAIKELSDALKKSGVSVKYAIHPVAGRMPGHMNVLLAEANVPYEEVLELDEINRDFATCDVAYIVGANDITNPAAKNDPTSSIYGMPILDVSKAKVVLFVKRSMGAGYAGLDNELFYAPNTMMLLGDAKKVTEDIIKSL